MIGLSAEELAQSGEESPLALGPFHGPHPLREGLERLQLAAIEPDPGTDGQRSTMIPEA
jgi:hypothetical protein